MKLLSKLQEQKPKLFESKETLHNACENIKTKPRPPRLLYRTERHRYQYRADITTILFEFSYRCLICDVPQTAQRIFTPNKNQRRGGDHESGELL